MAVGAGLVVVLHACREDTYSEVNPIRQESRVLNRTRFDVSFFSSSVQIDFDNYLLCFFSQIIYF